MTSLPWTGLALAAARVDLWPIIERLGGALCASGAPGVAWLEAGLPFDLLRLLTQPAVEPGGVLLTADMPGWPSGLTNQPFGPVALGTQGDLGLLRRTGVAVVGARACTPYGQEHAAAIARAVAESGGVVVSGLARGVDRAAHLAAPGATIAVLGQGIASVMPTWQQALRERILADGGLVVSEFPCGMAADKWTFPVRNRIVAGLAAATVVVEAAHKSGARNTAGHALRLGREVLAVPGALGAAASDGCLDLLEEGATMVRGPVTVLRAAGLPVPTRAPPRGSVREVRVLGALGTGGTSESIATLMGLAHPEVVAALVTLGLTGRVVRLPGGRYVPRGPP